MSRELARPEEETKGRTTRSMVNEVSAADPAEEAPGEEAPHRNAVVHEAIVDEHVTESEERHPRARPDEHRSCPAVGARHSEAAHI